MTSGRDVYDVIIPARNEERTIAAVVAAAVDAPRSARVIVVDDGSADATAAEATRAGADVLRATTGGNKARALAAGFAASHEPVVVFFDADITGVAPWHFELLAAPVLEGRFRMCCGLVDYGVFRGAFYERLPPITGLRALRREVFAAIPERKLNGFQIEIMINEVVARAGDRTAIRTLVGTGHRTKLGKMGTWRGFRAHISMTVELLHCLTFVPLWTYGSYLSNLTILPRRNGCG